MQSRTFLAATLLLAGAVPATAQAAKPESRPPICLKVRDIQDASSKDGKIMTFQMKDGTVYANHLRQTCDSLRYGGFVWTVNQTAEVCEGVQVLRTLTVGEICRLGAFDPPVHLSRR